MKKPKVIVLCGSSRFCDIMAVCAWLLEKEEGAITMGLHLLPIWYPGKIPYHLAEVEDVKDHMDNLHLRKIDLGDEIFVVNKAYYIGNSTNREINYAIKNDVPIRYYMEDEIGIKVEKMIDKFLKSK